MRVSNREDLPELLYTALAENRPPVPGEIHVTQLISPVLCDVLRRNFWSALEEDASERMFRLMGKGLHAAIANDGRIEHVRKVLTDVVKDFHAMDPDIVWTVLQDLLKALDSLNRFGIESNLELDIAGWHLVGTDDHYDEALAKVMDWKCTTVWSIIFNDHNWEEQLNIYAYIRRKLGYEVKSLEVWTLLRDWQKNKAKWGHDPKYPKVPFARVELPLWTVERQEKYILERLDLFTKVIDGDIKAPECTPKEKWQSPTQYKVMKKGKKTAEIATIYNPAKEKREPILSVAEALEAASAKKLKVDGENIYVQEFPGMDKRCEDYCVVNVFCPYYKPFVGDRPDE